MFNLFVFDKNLYFFFLMTLLNSFLCILGENGICSEHEVPCISEIGTQNLWMRDRGATILPRRSNNSLHSAEILYFCKDYSAKL